MKNIVEPVTQKKRSASKRLVLTLGKFRARIDDPMPKTRLHQEPSAMVEPSGVPPCKSWDDFSQAGRPSIQETEKAHFELPAGMCMPTADEVLDDLGHRQGKERTPSRRA